MRAFAWASAVVLVASARTASAGSTDAFGYGSRSAALGGAVSADSSDVSANYYNPAGLAAAKGLTFEVGYLRALYALKMNGRDNQVDPVRGMYFGLVAPGEVAGIPFAFGVGLHLPDDRVFRVRSLDQEQPRWEMYDNRPQRIFLATNLAIRPLKWLEIGGGLVYLAATRASLDITGRLEIASPRESELRHEVDADLTSIRYPQAGVRVHATDKLRFAAVYRGEFQLTLDISARLDVEANALGISVPFLTYITTRSVNAFLPRQAVFGASWDPHEQVTVDLDVTWVNWAAYKSPVTAVQAVTQFEAPPGFPPSLVPEKPAPTVILPPRFQDRFVPRVGVEGRLPLGTRGHFLAGRLGYFYERSPIPEQTGGTNFVDADRHAVSLGAGVSLRDVAREIPGDLRFDVHGMYSILPERLTAKGSAASAIGDYTAGGHIWSLGAVMGLRFR
ncbi:MAG: outer membrane protein transport protein [Deltaproteobacteria bacterium]|nr:outer membrane protein transport protein [Deltaproteobacteria bacterium]